MLNFRPAIKAREVKAAMKLRSRLRFSLLGSQRLTWKSSSDVVHNTLDKEHTGRERKAIDGVQISINAPTVWMGEFFRSIFPGCWVVK